jgi:hypothetical protein
MRPLLAACFRLHQNGRRTLPKQLVRVQLKHRLQPAEGGRRRRYRRRCWLRGCTCRDCGWRGRRRRRRCRRRWRAHLRRRRAWLKRGGIRPTDAAAEEDADHQGGTAEPHARPVARSADASRNHLRTFHLPVRSRRQALPPTLLMLPLGCGAVKAPLRGLGIAYRRRKGLECPPSDTQGDTPCGRH